MPVNLTLSVGTLYAFLLVLARVAGAFSFVPLPGIKGVPEPVRAALALACTLALFARWPMVNASMVTISTLAAWVLAEAVLGLAIPAKMLTSLLILSWLAALFPRVLGELSGRGWSTAHRMLGI